MHKTNYRMFQFLKKIQEADLLSKNLFQKNIRFFLKLYFISELYSLCTTNVEKRVKCIYFFFPGHL